MTGWSTTTSRSPGRRPGDRGHAAAGQRDVTDRLTWRRPGALADVRCRADRAASATTSCPSPRRPADRPVALRTATSCGHAGTSGCVSPDGGEDHHPDDHRLLLTGVRYQVTMRAGPRHAEALAQFFLELPTRHHLHQEDVTDPGTVRSWAGSGGGAPAGWRRAGAVTGYVGIRGCPAGRPRRRAAAGVHPTPGEPGLGRELARHGLSAARGRAAQSDRRAVADQEHALEMFLKLGSPARRCCATTSGTGTAGHAQHLIIVICCPHVRSPQLAMRRRWPVPHERTGRMSVHDRRMTDAGRVRASSSAGRRRPRCPRRIACQDVATLGERPWRPEQLRMQSPDVTSELHRWSRMAVQVASAHAGVGARRPRRTRRDGPDSAWVIAA